MSPVGGSRHYTGAGLGDERGWRCPACGAENLTLIAEGCGVCGSGKPGVHHDGPPPAPPLGPESFGGTDYPEPPAEGPEQLGAFDRWALAHPRATLEEAFTAGVQEGVRLALDAQQRTLREGPPPASFRPEGIVNRTIIAALELFRDQVLVNAPDEIASGEWLPVAQLNSLLRQLRTQEEELAHA